MRNSFSLSVFIQLGCKCDVKIIYKTSDTASGNMKLIPLILFISIVVGVECNELFTLPPKFHPSNSGVMLSSDSSIYLPPESHTAAPYYPMKNVNNLPFPYLPHTGTKAPMMHPTPYPIILSSKLLPVNDDADDDDEDNKQSPSFQIHKNNRTLRGHHENIERNSRQKSINYQLIDRIDTKTPVGFFLDNPSTQQNAPQQKATPRSMIISAEPQRNEGLDHHRVAATYQGPQYLPAPNIPGVYISSTTETAVPILRLSNEMDLDGSFSYEALGADQTHYVQHSHMENMGTDKEEQVVEGSYSYVGDNGQTYTVHYVADSNGFRASGDHLPVAPPIPEIIQRAVQFNLAEEAKRPPNQKSWNEEKESELSESEMYQQFVIPPTPRPLFTGKTPESFSFGFNQGAHNPQNVIPAGSTQNPIRANNDILQEQIKINLNNGNNARTISPQITFLASQGAYLPNANTQKSISRIFTTDRSTLPQIFNYETTVKEEPVTAQLENNKGLWQYGLNPNVNQTPEKNTISRSSGVGDDVMIHFGEMTHDQYTKMLKFQLEPNMDETQADQTPQSSDFMKVYKEPNHNTKVNNGIKPDPKLEIISPDSSFTSTLNPDRHENNKPYDNNTQMTENSRLKQNVEESLSSRSKLITQNNFIPQSQLITQSYDYDDISYEPKRISRFSSTVAPEVSRYFNYNNMNNEKGTQNILWDSLNQIENVHKVLSTEAPVISTTLRSVQFNDFVVKGNTNDFKPIIPSHAVARQEEQTTTTEAIEENIFESNMFLKNLFRNNKNDQYPVNNIIEENKKYETKYAEQKPEKTQNILTNKHMQAKPYNNIKELPKKPLELVDIMNYLSAKNHFESIKIKPKFKYGSNNYNHRSEFRFIPVQQEQINSDENDDEDENMDQNTNNHRTSYYHPEELRGIIKNYKVLQRNNNAFKHGQDLEQLKRDLSPPPGKILQTNLPPLGRAGPSVKSYLPPIYV